MEKPIKIEAVKCANCETYTPVKELKDPPPPKATPSVWIWFMMGNAIGGLIGVLIGKQL